MSGRRWLLLSVSSSALLCAGGCQSDGAKRAVWNPFARADRPQSSAAEDKFSLPRFARRKPAVDEEVTTPAEESVPLADSRVDLLLAEGQQAIADGRLAEARQAYEQILRADPEHASAHHELAMVGDLSSDWQDAEYHYKEALRIRPRDANLLCDVGYSYLLQDRYAEASRYLDKAVELQPDHEIAHMNLALLDLKQGRRAAAEDRVRRRHPNLALSSQLMAQLDSQLAQMSRPIVPANAATGIPASPASAPVVVNGGPSLLAPGVGPQVPPNASLQDVMAMAEKERRAAEQLRVMKALGETSQAANPAAPVYPNAPANPAPPFATTPQANPGNVPVNPALAVSTAAVSLPATVNAPAAAPAESLPQPGTPTVAPPAAAAWPWSSAAVPGAPTSAAIAPGTSAALSPVAGAVMPVRSSGAFRETPSTAPSMNSQPVQPATWSNNGPGALENATMTSDPSRLRLEGLNVGPGALFPVGHNPQSAPPAASMPATTPTSSPVTWYPGSSTGLDASAQAGTPGGISLPTAPGGNSVLNGAGFSAPVSSTPAHEWMLQQQAAQRAAAEQAGSAARSANNWPAASNAPVDPMAAYALERQKLEAQYYNAQMPALPFGGNTSAGAEGNPASGAGAGAGVPGGYSRAARSYNYGNPAIAVSNGINAGAPSSSWPAGAATSGQR